MKKWLSIALCLLLLIMILGGCAPSAETEGAAEKPADGGTAGDLLTVKVAVTPYTMYMLYPVAKELGLDKKFGLNLELTSVASQTVGATLLVRNDVDVSAACISDHLAMISGSPDITNFMPVGFFKGFIFIGRADEWLSWDEVLIKHGGNAEAAKEARVKEFKGKSFVNITTRYALILDMLAQYGLGEDDVDFMDFSEDAKASAAFLGGCGDVFIGSLATAYTMLNDESGNYINLGGHEILGPAGMWFDTMLTNDKFMLENREAAIRLMAMTFAAIEAFNKDVEGFSEIAARYLTEYTGSQYNVQDYIIFQTEKDVFQTLSDAKEGFFNPGSNMYWANPVDYNIQINIKNGDLKEGVSGKQYYGASEDLFNELLERQDLIDLIYN